jgi:hypothetical protein
MTARSPEKGRPDEFHWELAIWLPFSSILNFVEVFVKEKAVKPSYAAILLLQVRTVGGSFLLYNIL